MKISKFLIAALVLGTSMVGASFRVSAAEPDKPSSPMGGAPSSPLGAPSTPTGASPSAQADPSAPTGGGSAPSSPLGTPSTPAGGSPTAPSDPSAAPTGGGSSPSAPSDPSAAPSAPSDPSAAPTGGGSSPSSSSSGTVLATCGPNNATFVFDGTDQAPVGCKVSTINAPPAAALK